MSNTGLLEIYFNKEIRIPNEFIEQYDVTKGIVRRLK